MKTTKRYIPEGHLPVTDLLVDRSCVMLDGSCDCIRLPGESFPECKKYGAKDGSPREVVHK